MPDIKQLTAESIAPHLLTQWVIPLNLIQLDQIITALTETDDETEELADYLAGYRIQAVLRINNATDMTHA